MLWLEPIAFFVIRTVRLEIYECYSALLIIAVRAASYVERLTFMIRSFIG
jgi:hypothetical protein